MPPVKSLIRFVRTGIGVAFEECHRMTSAPERKRGRKASDAGANYHTAHLKRHRSTEYSLLRTSINIKIGVDARAWRLLDFRRPHTV